MITDWNRMIVKKINFSVNETEFIPEAMKEE